MGILQFSGTEKQVKWANDIINRAKDRFDKELVQIREDVLHGQPQSILDNAEILTKIVKDILSDLPSVWTAKDVIDNRECMDNCNTGVVWEKLGIRRRGNSLKIGESSEKYSYDFLKDENNMREFEKMVLQFLEIEHNL